MTPQPQPQSDLNPLELFLEFLLRRHNLMLFGDELNELLGEANKVLKTLDEELMRRDGIN